MVLTQRKFLLKKEFTILEDSLIIKTSDVTNSSEIKIDFEDIDTSNISKHKSTDNLMLIVTSIFTVSFLVNLCNPKNYEAKEDPMGVLLFLLVISIICGLITYIKSKNVVLIGTLQAKFIEIYNDKPTKDIQEKFIEELKMKVNAFLKKKYSKIDYDLPAEPQLMNFSWLKNRNIISEHEYESLKEHLLRKTKSKDNIGFN